MTGLNSLPGLLAEALPEGLNQYTVILVLIVAVLALGVLLLRG